VLLVVVALGLLAQSPVRADSPLRLNDQLTDRAGVLDGRRVEAMNALNRLRSERGLQLFVVFVHSFSGMPAQQWTDTTAQRSDLGRRDGLLAVATRDRSYAYSFDKAFPLTDDQLDEVANTAIEPALAQNDWAGAVVGAADGYRAVLAGQPVPTPRIVPGQPDTGGGLGGVAGLVGASACLLGLAVAVGLGGWLWWRARRGRAARAGRTALPDKGAPGPGPLRPAPAPAAGTQELTDRANDLLVELDDELRSSEREVDLAKGQYGAEATASFVAALEFAREEVAEAFRLRLSLDNESAVDDTRRRQILTEIISRCEAADQRLDAEADAFHALRALEARVEELIPALDRRRTQVEARLPTAASALDDLRARYADSALAPVSGNVAQAHERAEFAAAALARAAESLGAGPAESQGAGRAPGESLGAGRTESPGESLGAGQSRSAAERGGGEARPAAAETQPGGGRPAAAVAVRAAEEALDQADTLLNGITRAGADLDAARVTVNSLLAEVAADLAAAAAVRQPVAALAPVAARAEQIAASVRTEMAGPEADPLSAARRLQEADAQLDRALAESRDAGQRLARAQALLDHALLTARAEVSAAAEFITTRRGAVGSRPRTWLAEAERCLARAQAFAGEDPQAALAEAQRASDLAAKATQAAGDDVDNWYGGHDERGGAALGALAGAILGGILAGGPRGGLGGRWGGGGWGGAGWGGGGGGWGGGFGGSGSRHGGGGRF
jgi:uncharacterized membrane protein YgcG